MYFFHHSFCKFKRERSENVFVPAEQWQCSLCANVLFVQSSVPTMFLQFFANRRVTNGRVPPFPILEFKSFQGNFVLQRGAALKLSCLQIVLIAHDCGYPLSRYTCRATLVAADFLDFIAFCRCSTGVALHPL